MNQGQLTGVVRAVLPAILAYCAAKGWITDSSIADISAAVVAVMAAVWSVHTNTDNQVIKTVAAMPDVTKITVKATATDGIADAAKDPSQPKVVTQ